ncbi:unnamed protein product [Cyclocybe aegerita]|uniref:Uncharacterized protein n=1 Tax=Cyclocybe aegerita TaxID=1973307 RepID=A0A8S0XDZ4_CYCAE|nr:unnamed protein product [Cyclocybe aegerita]
MAPVRHSSSSPPMPRADSPEEIAKRMVRYTEIFILSGTRVRAEPDRMAATSATLQAEGGEVPLKAGAIPDPMAALKFYDETLATAPKSFMDHYYHFHYASSAAILVTVHIITPRAARDPLFFQAYTNAFAKMNELSRVRLGQTDSAESSQCQAMIGRSEANALVQDVRRLRTMKFHAFEGEDVEESGNWQVVGIFLAEDGDEEYSVRFNHLSMSLPFDKAELVELLTKSAQQ